MREHIAATFFTPEFAAEHPDVVHLARGCLLEPST